MKERSIGEQLKRISCRLGALADADMKSHGLTFSQARVLTVIGRNDGEMPQKEIEKKLNVSHPTVTGIVKRLEASGFVSVRVDENDRRNRIIVITEKARDVTQHMEKGRRKLNSVLAANMTAEEQNELIRLLSIMEDNLK